LLRPPAELGAVIGDVKPYSHDGQLRLEPSAASRNASSS
jgi:hypothetical protein